MPEPGRSGGWVKGQECDDAGNDSAGDTKEDAVRVYTGRFMVLFEWKHTIHPEEEAALDIWNARQAVDAWSEEEKRQGQFVRIEQLDIPEGTAIAVYLNDLQFEVKLYQ